MDGDTSGVNNIASSFVLQKELHGNQSLGARCRAIKEIANRVPPLMSNSLSKLFPGSDSCDKIFTSCWVNPVTVALGTKDNKCFLWDVAAGEYKTLPVPEAGSNIPADACGIHDIDINPSRQLMASGGKSPLDILIYNTSTWLPMCLLKGHTDWVFGNKFLEEDYLVSASRDTTVSLWKLANMETDTIPVVEPLLTCKEHEAKVRAIQYHRFNKQIITVSLDSTVKIWDRTNMNTIISKDFNEEEMVCMAVDETRDIVGIGHHAGASILDIRTGETVADIPSKNHEWGIRSIDFFHHMASIGGGYGRLAFYDLRSKSFLQMLDEKKYMTLREGPIRNLNDDSSIHRAIYTHKFNPVGDQLVVAGGPLTQNGKGCHASVW